MMGWFRVSGFEWLPLDCVCSLIGMRLEGRCVMARRGAIGEVGIGTGSDWRRNPNLGMD